VSAPAQDISDRLNVLRPRAAPRNGGAEGVLQRREMSQGTPHAAYRRLLQIQLGGHCAHHRGQGISGALDHGRPMGITIAGELIQARREAREPSSTETGFHHRCLHPLGRIGAECPPELAAQCGFREAAIGHLSR